MKLRYLFTLVLAFIICNSNAQTAHKDVLFVLDSEPVYISEFLRVYNKNLDLVQDESQKDVDTYLKLFTNYKLKLKEAKTLGLDKKASYKREFESYKKQLAKSFITDSKVTNSLVEEAYERISYDINASHILIKFAENASPEDTLQAYEKIIKLRQRALAEGFDVVRKEVHNGQTVFGERLGYFSGFRMVYTFENVAFNTPVGDVSQPFRTRFGYHIINVTDKRKSRGERTVSHIMIADKKEDTLSEKPEVKIQEIYKKIQQGEAFEALAKQFSDDKSSASKGGQLAPFSSGQLSAQEFEDIAFGLETKDDISEPFKTKYGWHIVKLVAKKLIPPFEEIRSELEEKVKRDERSKLIDEALYSSLKSKYNVSNDQSGLNYFVSIFNEDYFKRTWQLPNNFTGDTPLFKIKNKAFLYKDFGDYLVKTQRRVTAKGPFKKIILNKYNAFLNSSLVKYQEDNLENENQDFANIVTEYRDGLLLFDLMESTIWNASKTDSVAISKYYDAHKSNYVLPERIDAVVASSTKQKTLKKVAKLLKQGKTLDEIKAEVNSDSKIEVSFNTGVMESSHQALPETFQFKKGISKVYKHNSAFVIVQVKDILPKSQKSFDEAKGSVISDYQVYKEKTWLKTLKEKYKIVVNQEALENVKSQIKKQ